MIKTGMPIPSATVFRHGANGPETFDIAEYASTGVTVFFALPAAFSPTCSDKQLPSFIRESANLIAAGAQRVACVSVNDTFVMNAWGNQLGAKDSGIDMISDAYATFTRLVDADIDLSVAGLGIRSKRYVMIVRDGTVVAINEEEDLSKMRITGAEDALKALQSL